MDKVPNCCVVTPYSGIRVRGWTGHKFATSDIKIVKYLKILDIPIVNFTLFIVPLLDLCNAMNCNGVLTEVLLNESIKNKYKICE